MTPEIRLLPPRDKRPGPHTLVAVQDEQRSKPGQALGVRGAPVSRVSLFSAIEAWGNYEPRFGAAVQFLGDVDGDVLPVQHDRASLGTATKRWFDATIRTIQSENIFATLVDTTQVDTTDIGISGAASFLNRASARFWDSGSGRYLGLRAPATLAANTFLNLPDGDGTAGQQLQTDGAGNLSWGAAEGTAAAILAKLLTVDGAGSGLDADLLDGLSGAGYAAAIHAHAWSDVSKSGSSLADLATRSASDLSSGALGAARGGTNLDTSASTGMPVIAAGVWSVQTPTGTGAPVRANAPALVTPALGTPASGVLTSCTGLPIASGVAGLGTGIATALAVAVGSNGAPVVQAGALGTPTSGNLAACTNVRHWIGSYCNGVTCDTTRKSMPLVGTLSAGSIFATVQRTNMPAGTLREIRFWCQTGPGANTYTVRFNNITAGTTSSFTVTAAGATTSTGLSFAISAGDLCTWDIIASAGSVADNLSCLFLIEY